MNSGAFPTKLLGCFAGRIENRVFVFIRKLNLFCGGISLTAVAVRVLVGFNRVSIPTRIVRMLTGSPARLEPPRFLVVPIRGASFQGTNS